MYKIILLTDVWNGQYVGIDWPSGNQLKIVDIRLKGYPEMSYGVIKDGIFIKDEYEKLYSNKAQIHLNGFEYEGIVVFDTPVNKFFSKMSWVHYYWYEFSIHGGIQRLNKWPYGKPVDPVVKIPDLKDFPSFLSPSGVIRYKIDEYYLQKCTQDHV